MSIKVGKKKLYRVGKMISHIRLDNLPPDVLLELAKPKRVGKMKSHITKEVLKKLRLSLK